jgi:pimeloyl-ACP methyl ester carboxylesterase
MAFITLGTLKLWYDIHGHGPRVVLIPGTASDLRQPWNIFARPLIEHCEVLRFDPRRIGQAHAPDAAPTMSGERGADLVREPLRLAA